MKHQDKQTNTQRKKSNTGYIWPEFLLSEAGVYIHHIRFIVNAFQFHQHSHIYNNTIITIHFYKILITIGKSYLVKLFSFYCYLKFVSHISSQNYFYVPNCHLPQLHNDCCHVCINFYFTAILL